MNFSELLIKSQPSLHTPLIVTESAEVGLSDLTLDQSGEAEPLPDQICISFSSTIDLLKALAACDGRVQSILLLSPNVIGSTAESLVRNAAAQIVFSDRHDGLDALPLTTLLKRAAQTSDGKQTSWLLATSGTTETPKLVAHTLQSLTRSVNRNASGSQFVWGQMYDSYRFAGMQVLLQAMAAGNPLVAPTQSMALCEKLRLFVREGVNAVSATPTLWRKILMIEQSSMLDLKSITLGGEIVDQTVLDILNRRYPQAKIRHIYASTEAGTGFAVSDGRAGFPISFLTTGYRNIRIKIIDNILHINNPYVTGSYYRTNTSFVAEDAFVNTGDRVRIDDNRVTFLGRSSGVINVGGEKVFPERVEQILNSIEGIAISKVFGKKSPITGELVAAEIVLLNGHDPKTMRTALVDVCKKNLQPFERPFAYKFVDNIAVSENGKVVR